MAENKTAPTDADAAAFIASIEDSGKREDAKQIAAIMQRVSGHPPRLWGPSIVGFGTYHYRYASGREGDSPRVGFSPRKAALTLYLTDGFPYHAEVMSRLGSFTTGKACLYIKRLSDIDVTVLEELIRASLAHMAELYPAAD